MTLYVYCENLQLRQAMMEYIHNRRPTDSGFDLPMLRENIQMNEITHTFNLGIKVAATDGNDNPLPCLLLPRSSLSATPFRLSNSIGLIDSGYRGEVKAKVDVLDRLAINPNDDQYIVNYGTRLFQICQHSFLPWDRVQLVQFENELPQARDNRGAGGFGSTGN